MPRGSPVSNANTLVSNPGSNAHAPVLTQARPGPSAPAHLPAYLHASGLPVSNAKVPVSNPGSNAKTPVSNASTPGTNANTALSQHLVHGVDTSWRTVGFTNKTSSLLGCSVHIHTENLPPIADASTPWPHSPCTPACLPTCLGVHPFLTLKCPFLTQTRPFRSGFERTRTRFNASTPWSLST